PSGSSTSWRWPTTTSSSPPRPASGSGRRTSAQMPPGKSSSSTSFSAMRPPRCRTPGGRVLASPLVQNHGLVSSPDKLLQSRAAQKSNESPWPKKRTGPLNLGVLCENGGASVFPQLLTKPEATLFSLWHGLLLGAAGEEVASGRVFSHCVANRLIP